MIRTDLPILLLLLFLLLPPLPEAAGQRNITYQELLLRAEQPRLYTTTVVLPGRDSPLFMAAFRMEYDLLTFRRQQNGPDGESFYSPTRVNLELFRQNGERVSVGRSSWADTAHAATYEQTRSRSHYLEGAVSRNLPPGEYSLSIDLLRDTDGSAPRFNRRSAGRDEPGGQVTPGRTTFRVPDLDSDSSGTLVLLASQERLGDEMEARLLNFGEFTQYGQDYLLMVQLPRNESPSTYRLRAERLQRGSGSGTEEDPLFETEITADRFIRTDGFYHPQESIAPRLRFRQSGQGYPVAILPIPAAGFPNVSYRLSLVREGESEPFLQKNVHSRWADMPASLLNLNVAIDMLRFIVDEDQLREMRRGSASDRERKFREFWARRDPTPGTEFNELMTEYYRRIDQAWQLFTTPEQIGYESDQGRAHILYGPPDRKERIYPTNSPTRELWYYPNRTLVFEATSGFGNFRLVDSGR